MRSFFKLVLILLGLVGGLFASEQKAIIIFDASGSMWGQINGVPKIKIAKDALKKVVKSWNPNVQLGLTVYGHRRKGDCNDIQSVVPVGAVDKGRIVKSVMAISPKGKTPISRAIKRAADELKYTEDKATVILISDGKETCDPDPCGTAKELKKQGIDFVAHVIGFNVDKATDKQLQCIANATGGEYFSAKNADALNKAMKTIVKKVEKPKAPKETLVRISGEYSVYKPQKPQSGIGGIHWQVIQDGKVIYDNGKEYVVRPELKVKVAPITVKAEISNLTDFNATAQKTVELKPLKEQWVTLYLPSGLAVIDAAEQEGQKKLADVVFNIYPIKDGEADRTSSMWCASIKSQKWCKYALIPGDYIISAKYNKSGAKAEKQVHITDGKKTPVHIYLTPSGKVEISVREKEGGKLIASSGNIYKDVDGKAEGSSFKSAYTQKGKSRVIRLPAGKYILNTSYNSYEKSTPFEIKAGSDIKLDIIMGQTGNVEVTASEKEGGKWVDAGCRAYKIIDGEVDDSDDWYLGTYKKKPRVKKLPVGKYLLKCSYNDYKKETNFEVKAGETTKVHLNMGQTGKVEVTASEKEGGKWIDASCRAYKVIDGEVDDSDNWYLGTYKKKPRVKKMPLGKYLLKCSYNNFKKQTNFEIKAGETTKVHIVFAPFHINVKGVNPCAKIHFEVIASDGQTVLEKDSPAYKGIDFTVSKGKYTVEATLDDKKINTKINVGVGQESASVDFGGDETLSGIEGVWKTSEGRATIALDGKKVHGYYDNDNGELIGEMTYPKRFEGYWIEDKSNEKCSTAKNGRYYWGKVVWKFDDKMCSFSGRWSYCNKKPNRSWSGSYIRPLNENDRRGLLIKDDASSNSKAENNTAPKEESLNSKEANKSGTKTIKIGDKVINIEGLSDEQIKKLKDMKKMLEVFGNKK